MAIQTIDMGDHVECDICGADYTGRNDEGGILFAGKAVCPKCVAETLRLAELYDEQRYITARCPPRMRFCDWVLFTRFGDNTFHILTGDDAKKAMGLT